MYDGFVFWTLMPNGRDLALLIFKLGRGCLIYKYDYSCAYRQLRVDPLDWPLLGIKWKDIWYWDQSIPFGVKWGAAMCQRVSDAICHISRIECGASNMAYIDDTVGGALGTAKAARHFEGTRKVMLSVGMKVAPEKCQAPCTRMIWIGILWDTIAMTMTINPEKIAETRELCMSILECAFLSKNHWKNCWGNFTTSSIRPRSGADF